MCGNRVFSRVRGTLDVNQLNSKSVRIKKRFAVERDGFRDLSFWLTVDYGI